MHRRTGGTAALLTELGVAAGDRVALLCRNRIEFFEVLFACARIGAILVPLNWRMPATELATLVADCGARCLLHGAEDAEDAHRLADRNLPLVDLDDPGETGFAARRDAQQPLLGTGPRQADETWYLLYTSGTTGMPKAVIQTFGMALANYVNISQGMGLRGNDTTLCYLPLFHSGGINLTALPTLFMGARLLITPGFDPERTVALIDEGRIDTFFGVPAVYQAISLNPRFEEIDLGSVRCWGCGGAPLPDSLFRRFAKRGATVLNGMGMTETGPTVFLMDPENARRKIGSVGKPQLLSAVRLVADGQDVPQGETGEIWFAGPGVTPGYFNRPEETAKALTMDGWLRSGDLGQQDEDGYYYVVGRLKDMYISGGENVYPAEVENQLAGHPDVLEAAVVGVPDERWGEVGCAYLLPRPGHSLPDDAALQRYLRERLAAYKVPRYFERLAEFPRTAAGKVQKHLLPEPPIRAS
jgi:fatty-acyl-CoA synthase